LLFFKKKTLASFFHFSCDMRWVSRERSENNCFFCHGVLSTVCNTGVFGRYPTPKRWGTNSTTKMVTLQINDTTKMHGAHS
jgi:hypothetical protein